MKNQFKHTLKIFSLALFLLLFSCGKNEKQEKTNGQEIVSTSVELTPAQCKNAGIELGKPELRQLSNTIKVSGILDVPPQNLVSISAPLGGFIKNTELLQGMKIKKGQVIATMEHQDYIQMQEEYITAKSKLDYTTIEYDRLKELNKENYSSVKSLQQMEMEHKSLKAKVNALEEKLAMINISPSQLLSGKISRTINIISPINGYVKDVNVNIGKYVNPTDVIFEIVDTEHLHAELTVFEKDAIKVKEGQKITFTLPNDNDVIRTARVHLVGRSIGLDKTVRVHGHLDKEDPELLPGMYVKAEIEITNNMVTSLPESSVLLFNGKHYVFISKGNNTFEMIEVETGVTENGFTEVVFPESYKNEQLVVKGARSILAKMKNSEEE